MLTLTPDLFATVRCPTEPGVRFAVGVRHRLVTVGRLSAMLLRPRAGPPFPSDQMLMQAINPSGVMAYASHLAAALPESRLKSTDSLRYGAARGWRVGERI